MRGGAFPRPPFPPRAPLWSVVHQWFRKGGKCAWPPTCLSHPHSLRSMTPEAACCLRNAHGAEAIKPKLTAAVRATLVGLHLA